MAEMLFRACACTVCSALAFQWYANDLTVGPITPNGRLLIDTYAIKKVVNKKAVWMYLAIE
jgi:hypothetical protein